MNTTFAESLPWLALAIGLISVVLNIWLYLKKVKSMQCQSCQVKGDYMSMHEQFKAKYPVPDGVVFDEESNAYRIAPGGISMQQHMHCLRWEMWVEARASMVVELPKGGSMWDDEPIEIKRSDAVDAIEAAGGSVKP